MQKKILHVGIVPAVCKNNDHCENSAGTLTSLHQVKYQLGTNIYVKYLKIWCVRWSDENKIPL